MAVSFVFTGQMMLVVIYIICLRFQSGSVTQLMLRYDSLYLTCSKKLTGSQLSLMCCLTLFGEHILIVLPLWHISFTI